MSQPEAAQAIDEAEIFDGIAEECSDDFENAFPRLAPSGLTAVGSWLLAKGYAAALAERRRRDRARLREERRKVPVKVRHRLDDQAALGPAQGTKGAP